LTRRKSSFPFRGLDQNPDRSLRGAAEADETEGLVQVDLDPPGEHRSCAGFVPGLHETVETPPEDARSISPLLVFQRRAGHAGS
jgi:hypothetical protein